MYAPWSSAAPLRGRWNFLIHPHDRIGREAAMMRQLSLALGVAFALVWSATALAAESKVLFILDGSGSMQTKINGQSKIDIARTVMGNLLKSLPAEVQIGLETYGHSRKN